LTYFYSMSFQIYVVFDLVYNPFLTLSPVTEGQSFQSVRNFSEILLRKKDFCLRKWNLTSIGSRKFASEVEFLTLSEVDILLRK
jgi:hypothetical protein